MQFLGYWDALNNKVLGSATDFLAPGPGQRPGYYVVRVEGATMLEGNNVWRYNDIVLQTGFEWLRIPGSKNMLQTTIGTYLRALEQIAGPGSIAKLEAAVPKDRSDATNTAFYFEPYVRAGGLIADLTESVFDGIDTNAVIMTALRYK